jgi:hypothetical protein
MEMNDPAILLEEINNQMNRLKDLAVVDYKKELLANNYPIIKMLAEIVVTQNERLDLAEGAIAEALTHMDSQILPELGAAIQMTLALGLQVCKSVNELGVWGEYPMPDELRATIQAYERASKQLSDDVSNVTLEAIEDEELLMNQMAAEMAGQQPQPDGDQTVIDAALEGGAEEISQ